MSTTPKKGATAAPNAEAVNELTRLEVSCICAVQTESCRSPRHRPQG